MRAQSEHADQDFELIAGVIIPLPTPSPRHNAIVMFIAAALYLFVYPRRIGRVFGDRTGYTLSMGDELIPDVSYISFARQPDLPEKLIIAPDLAVEVVSPSNSAGEIQTKVILYFQYGAPLVWIVYPDSQTIVVHTSARSSYTLMVDDDLTGENVLPGFVLTVRDIFDAGE